MNSIENINQIIEDENFLDDNGISQNNKIEMHQNNINLKLNSQITNQTPKAIPLVLFEKDKFIIPKEAKQLLNQSSYKHIGIISLVGKYRTGKSFLLNRVLLNRAFIYIKYSIKGTVSLFFNRYRRPWSLY